MVVMEEGRGKRRRRVTGWYESTCLIFGTFSGRTFEALDTRSTEAFGARAQNDAGRIFHSHQSAAFAG